MVYILVILIFVKNNNDESEYLNNLPGDGLLDGLLRNSKGRRIKERK